MEENFEDDGYLEYAEGEYDNIEECQSQIEELEIENNNLNLTINKMAEFIDKIDIKNEHCRGMWCTVGTTCYPEEERKKICVDCIKRTFRGNI